MFTPFCSADLRTVTLKDKRQLLIELKAAIKADVVLQKQARITTKQKREVAKKAKVAAAIKAVEEKLARLQAKLV